LLAGSLAVGGGAALRLHAPHDLVRRVFARHGPLHHAEPSGPEIRIVARVYHKTCEPGGLRLGRTHVLRTVGDRIPAAAARRRRRRHRAQRRLALAAAPLLLLGLPADRLRPGLLVAAAAFGGLGIPADRLDPRLFLATAQLGRIGLLAPAVGL